MLNLYGSNKEIILESILLKSQEERKIFNNEYLNTYDNEITAEIEEKLSGPTKFLFIGLLSKSLTTKAIFLNKAIDENNLECILNILFSIPLNELKKFNQVYDETYSESIVDQLKINYSDDFINLISKIIDGGKSNNQKSKHVEDDIILLRSILQTNDADPSEIYKVIFGKTYDQINDIYESYSKSYDRDLLDLFKASYNDDNLLLLEHLFKFSKNKSSYIAEVLHKLIKEENLNEFHIVCLINFYENDLIDISKQFGENYKTKISDTFKTKAKYEILNLIRKVFEYYS